MQTIDRVDFENLVNQVIKENGITKEELSRRLGRSKGYITELISRGNINVRHINAIKNLFKNSVNEKNEMKIIKTTLDVLMIEVARLSAQQSEKTPSKRLTELKEEIEMQLGLRSDS